MSSPGECPPSSPSCHALTVHYGLAGAHTFELTALTQDLTTLEAKLLVAKRILEAEVALYEEELEQRLLGGGGCGASHSISRRVNMTRSYTRRGGRSRGPCTRPRPRSPRGRLPLVRKLPPPSPTPPPAASAAEAPFAPPARS